MAERGVTDQCVDFTAFEQEDGLNGLVPFLTL